MATQVLGAVGADPTHPPSSAIRASRVLPYARMGFLPRVFGSRSYMQGESLVYTWMRRLSPDYTGGFWEYYDLSNRGFFMAPNAESCAIHEGRPALLIRCEEGNGFEGLLSPEAAGVLATAFAINHMLFTGHPHLEDAYYRLKDFVFEHAESRLLIAALD